MSVVKDQMRRIVGATANAYQMLYSGAHSNDRPRIEDIDHRRHREQIQLRRRVQRRIVSLHPRGTCQSCSHSVSRDRVKFYQAQYRARRGVFDRR